MGSEMCIRDSVKTATSRNRLSTTFTFHLKGNGLGALIAHETGAHLACDSAGKLNLIKTGFIDSQDPGFENLKSAMDKEKTPADDLASLLASCTGSNNSLKTLRMFEHKGNVIDFRTGSVQQYSAENALSNLISSGMPLSQEFVPFCNSRSSHAAANESN